ncbi:hypothetical protein CVU37_09110 [candidate division BRC1 bacterium HGW-BRC1-1]|jgi:drug/metabolite transporter (DMT)-like permease|nr:MAG: hypothetical protein CVU37_09110 [candidate division BRC1 bacterium HGW-BRC1-1]
MRPVDFFKVLLATLLWGTAFPFVKLGLQYSDPIGFAGLRFTFAGILLLVASLVWKVIRSRDKGEKTIYPPLPALWRSVALIGLLSTAIFYGMFFLGMARTSGASGALIDSASPIINSIMAHFVLHNDRIDRRKAMAILLAFGGIAIIAAGRPHGVASQSTSIIGCLFILGGLVVSSAGTMLVINYKGGLGLVRLTGSQQLFGGLLLLAVAALTENQRHWASLADWRFLIIVLWLALVSAVAFRIWYGIVRRYKVTSVAVYWFLIGIWGAGLSVIILGEPLTLNHGVGFSLVVAALVLMYRGKENASRVTATIPQQPVIS